jgi:hypothetical protein
LKIEDNPQPAKIPTLYSSGLAWSFYRLPHLLPAVVFLRHAFCNPRTIGTSLFRFAEKSISQPTREEAKRQAAPSATTVPFTPEKNNPKLYLHNM